MLWFLTRPGTWDKYYVLVDAQAVIATLPERQGAMWQAVHSLRKTYETEPANLDAALGLVSEYLTKFRQTGDPLLLSNAEVVLENWEGESNSAEFLLLRADAAQKAHRFDEALEILNELRRDHPAYYQASLNRAAILLVQGKLNASRTACEEIGLLQFPILVGACLAGVQMMTGQSEQALAILQHALERTQNRPNLAAWLHELAAAAALSLGQTHKVEAYLRNGIERSDQPSLPLRTALADLLLEQGRHLEVFELLDGADESTLRMRRAAAAKRLGSSISEDLQHVLSDLQLTMTGHDDTHAREGAWVALFLLNDLPLALDLAQQNWLLQKETADAALVLQAAISSCTPQAAAPVLSWMKTEGVQHQQLQTLKQALEERCT